MSQEEDMNAVNVYMRTTPIVNNAAFPIKNDFIKWWDNLGWWDKNHSSESWDIARTKRNKFMLANVKNEEQRAAVVKVVTTGIESEEMAGKPRPTTLSTGEVGSQVKKKPATAGVKSGVMTGPTIRKGSKGPDVIRWQTIIGVTADGNFGPGTEAATKTWQSQHGLTADGIVGAASWAAATPKAPPSDFAKPGEAVTPAKPNLTLNSRGADVSQWQNIVGVKPATGFFGQMTVDYTKRWQTQKGLPATGIVDAKSWEVALKAEPPFAPAVKPEPTFNPPAPAPTFKPTPTAPSSGTSSASSSGTKAKKKSSPGTKPTIATAGMFDFKSWPGWVQAGAAFTAIGGIVYAFMGGKVRKFG